MADLRAVNTRLRQVVADKEELIAGQKALLTAMRERSEVQDALIAGQAERLSMQDKLLSNQDELLRMQKEHIDTQAELIERLQDEITELRRLDASSGSSSG